MRAHVKKNGPSIRGRGLSQWEKQEGAGGTGGTIATITIGGTGGNEGNEGTIRENPIFPYAEIFGKSRGAQ